MTYVALLRGVNVGGKNKVEMNRLRQAFESLGLAHVKTYIASGNVVFVTDEADNAALANRIEAALEQAFGFPINVLLRDLHNIGQLLKILPIDWTDETRIRCYALFLWSTFDSPSVLEQLPLKPDVDEVLYSPGAVLWRIERAKVTKSRMTQIVGTPLYKQMTIRSLGTVRKLYDLMIAAEAAAK